MIILSLCSPILYHHPLWFSRVSVGLSPTTTGAKRASIDTVLTTPTHGGRRLCCYYSLMGLEIQSKLNKTMALYAYTTCV